MKKILVWVLSALMVLTAVAGVMAVSAADGDPVFLLDGPALKADAGNQVHGEYSYTDGFIHLTASDADPWYWLIPNGQNTQVGRYMTIKYKTTCEGMVGGMFASTGAFGEGGVYTSFSFDYPVKTGEWDILLIDLEEKLGDKYDENTNMLNHLRFDFTDGDTASTDHWVDIEYIAFFDSESDADAYEHTLPVDPEIAVEGCYKTIDFTGLTNEEVAAMIHGEPIDVEYNATETGVVFTATAKQMDGTDPYFTLKNPGAENHTLGITGKQARYVLVKYKTEADSKDPMQMALFMNVKETAIQWGHAQACVEADIVNDGEWHYVLFDATGAWGLFNNGLEAFRVDMLHACEAGESAELAEIKFFTTEAWVENYVEKQAATDAAAKELGIAKGWVECDHATTEDVPAVDATCTAAGKTAGKKCTVCGAITEGCTEVAANGHALSETVAAVAPTCTEAGKTAVMGCANCDYTEGGDAVDAAGHTEEIIPGKPATETETGLTEGKKCSVCDEILVAQEEIPVLNVEEETTAGEVEETDPVDDETDPVVDETDPVVDDETDPVVDDTADVEESTTDTPDNTDDGKKNSNAIVTVIVILAVVAVAAGAVVVIKKKGNA